MREGCSELQEIDRLWRMGDVEVADTATRKLRSFDRVEFLECMGILFAENHISGSFFVEALLTFDAVLNFPVIDANFGKLEAAAKYWMCIELQEFPTIGAKERLMELATLSGDPSTRVAACIALSRIFDEEIGKLLETISTSDHAENYEGVQVSEMAQAMLHRVRNRHVRARAS